MSGGSPSALLDELRGRGVRVEADGLTLRVDAPEEAATPTSCGPLFGRTSALSSGSSSANAASSKKPTGAGW